MGQSRHNNIKTNNRLSGCHPDINYQSVELTLFHISPPPPLLGVWTDCYTIIKFKNLVVAHSSGGRVGVWGGYGEGGVGRREIMCGCGLRKEREWWWL